MMPFRQLIPKLAVLLLLLLGSLPAQGFSLLGPFTTWQTSPLGYNLLATDQGGPMDLGEDYRYTLPTVTYGFDESFLTFFGTDGVQAVDKAFQILNNLPTAANINLAAYPPGNAALLNFQAQALGVRDLKSTVLSLMVEQLGLADPVRFTWTLRDIQPNQNNTATNYWVVRRNFDPVSRFYSSFVNGTLYTYRIRHFTTPLVFTDAVEQTSDPAQENDRHLPVAGRSPAPGEFYTGLTQDDVGGIKFLLSSTRYHIETINPSVLLKTNTTISPWTPVGGTNANTNITTLIATGVRGGVEKITFQKLLFDSLLGLSHSVTNEWTDRVRVLTNNTFSSQVLQRVSTNVDILFTADDLGLTPLTFVPLTLTRSVMTFVNNAARNQTPPATLLNGPGEIHPPVLVTFNRIGEFIVNSNFQNPFLDEANATRAFVWGSFDGTATPPIIYPNTLSLQALEQQIGLRR